MPKWLAELLAIDMHAIIAFISTIMLAYVRKTIVRFANVATAVYARNSSGYSLKPISHSYFNVIR
ncbi:hypothetical protein [Paenibacillus sp. TAF43_2]|uniref:hypothetical protein n=1 Tax=Paenibacillus sp. TAF43_2 TaxID=3233069 RepID=UPI003F9D92A0